jgi:glucose/arabinose dehydrogenase
MKRSFWIFGPLLLYISVAVAEDPKRSTTIRTQLLTNDLEHPSQITYAPGEPDRLYIVEREGLVRVLQNGKLRRDELLDIEGHVSKKPMQGLRSVAFPPDYQRSGVFYADLIDVQGDVVIGKFPRLKEDAADWNSLVVLMKFAQAFPNDNGSFMAFGPDSLLYVSSGDGGGPIESIEAAQRTSSLFGKVLRIMPTPEGKYTSPTDNPFSNRPHALPEIWAIGFKNPRHFSFDRQTGRLILEDEGRKTVELNRIDKGGNYGWNEAEATSCTRSNCPLASFTPPLTTIQSEGSPEHFVPGFIYRGSKIPALQGRYLFADSGSGQISTLAETNGGWAQTPLIKLAGKTITAIGEDSAGEPYIATDEGELFALIP